MKYGLLVNENNVNIGDDIQSYAAARFLPRVDVMVDRENLDVFTLKDSPREPVAVIMAAWFMWKKFNWPPAGQIIPLLVGYHHFDRREDPLANTYALPIFREHYEGIGGDWFRDYGPVGCRDLFTCGVLTEKKIPSYFSGCVTLTLPKQPVTEDCGKYVVFVDLNKDVEKKIREIVGDSYEIRVISHITPNIKGASWAERAKRVEEFLTLYQNAKYVVTRRLHVSLPCLAMGVPVMCIQSKDMNDPNRFDPYKKWLHFCNNNEFLKNGYEAFDFLEGTPNKENYLQTRRELVKRIEEFVAFCEGNADKDLSFFDKRSYSGAEENKWRVSFMRKILSRTHKESKALQLELLSAKRQNEEEAGKAAEARKEAEEAKMAMEDAKAEAEEARKELDKARKEAEIAKMEAAEAQKAMAEMKKAEEAKRKAAEEVRKAVKYARSAAEEAKKVQDVKQEAAEARKAPEAPKAMLGVKKAEGAKSKAAEEVMKALKYARAAAEEAKKAK